MRSFLSSTLTVAAAAALPLLSSGCAEKVPSQLVVVLQTDLSLPKDISSVRIQVLAEGESKFDHTYSGFGVDLTQKLPGTLVIDAPDKPDQSIDIRIGAFAGDPDTVPPRIVRQAVTTIPDGKTVTLQMPIQFLCDGRAALLGQDLDSGCPDGTTCLAGVCEDNKVDGSKLPVYEESKVFGDGECFDTSSCFDSGAEAEVDLASCTIAGGDDVNVALETEGDGICGAVGCFVALDANADLAASGQKTVSLGYTVLDGGKIQLPKGVCQQLQTGKIVRVVTTATGTGSCAKKQPSLPTCGPWSTGGGSTFKGAVAVAGGQSHPASVVTLDGNLFWIDGSGSDAASGAVKTAYPTGGAPVVVKGQQDPRDLAAGTGLVVWTTAGTAGTGTIGLARTGKNVNPPSAIISSLGSPEGVAVFDAKVYWTDFAAAGKIYSADLMGQGQTEIATGNYPYRIATDGTDVFWTNEGTAASSPPDGSIQRVSASGGTADVLVPNLSTPRAIALSLDGSGKAREVFYATFVEAGELHRYEISTKVDTVIASNQNYPNGIAIDGDTIYWSNRGDGTIRKTSRTATAAGDGETVASGQSAPASITFDKDNLYWINQGSSTVANGAVMRLAKKK